VNADRRDVAGLACDEPRLPRVGAFPPPRRIPPEDIVVIIRREPAGGSPASTRVVPRISRRRLAFRAVLVLALIGEVYVAARVWPRTPIAVPDASGPRNRMA
jgi:hypothetical protein